MAGDAAELGLSVDDDGTHTGLCESRCGRESRGPAADYEGIHLLHRGRRHGVSPRIWVAVRPVCRAKRLTTSAMQ